jgi:peroxiredoxin
MGFRAKEVNLGPTAPHLTLSSQSGALVSLRNFLEERPVVLSFYPGMVPQAAPGRRALSGTGTRSSQN